mmetsp:Transcript_65389/g.202541  ORF Transcript_65389/g.202541 Transcript_65389/m.202541 type:complete len:456 (-) Transcript_65389:64-1431(-)|eukprot:CAMPEP_0204591226 /NCGR_PEP_ID=MMETSP0661-20131031/50236_1 /ASSEMBLY_ACC=CAM_ASM_000606 /TAXON_ID=109239 /ORGANISM="Alexandrium margalefi, Strain AMGDE01CS-322" /LENGTH=455 /DNA_ID=CAMNT_0051601331 /DNA_START=31 /DNA_END=1398 /DNA_ORIENTATION=+
MADSPSVLSKEGGSKAAEFLHEADTSDDGSSSSSSSWSMGARGGFFLLKGIGPGLLVCLADTDAGCLIVAAQSGARWKYSLLLLQVILMPILFLTQELTIRLGVHTRKGQTACIRDYFGCFWAWLACACLVFECTFALITEMGGVAAVGELWGMRAEYATVLSAVAMVVAVFVFSYRQIEFIGVTLGLFELTFVFTMVWLRPDPLEVMRGSFKVHRDSEYWKLVSANIGAVIMPWMIYFQQSAVVARRLVTVEDASAERTSTLVGSVLTQLVMIGTLVTLAAAGKASKDLETVQDIVLSLEPTLGETLATALVSLGFVGGSLSAAFVVSLAASWAICEAMGVDDAFSLDLGPTKSPHFYVSFLLVVGVGIIVLLTGVNMIWLSICVELLDGLLMPLAVGFLFLLATGEALPPEVRVQGAHKVFLAVIFTLCTTISISSAVYGLVSEAVAGGAAKA